MSLISIVIPLYNEAAVLPTLLNRLSALISSQSSHRWEVLIVNDGSRDKTPELLSEAARQHAWLSVVHLSRNFGHQTAMAAGLDQSTGDAVVVMDGDLQDPPELVPEMIVQWLQGFDVVYATRRKRAGENLFKQWTAALYYRFLNQITEIDLPLDTGDFRLISRRIVDILKQMPEHHRYFRGLVSWIGFRQTRVYFDRDARFAGKPKNTWVSMERFAADGVFGFSERPLLFFGLGVVFLFTGILAYFLPVITTGRPNFPLTLLSIISIFAGLQLIGMWILASYLYRTLTEVRQRPLYIIDKIES